MLDARCACGHRSSGHNDKRCLHCKCHRSRVTFELGTEELRWVERRARRRGTSLADTAQWAAVEGLKLLVAQEAAERRGRMKAAEARLKELTPR